MGLPLWLDRGSLCKLIAYPTLPCTAGWYLLLALHSGTKESNSLPVADLAGLILTNVFIRGIILIS